MRILPERIMELAHGFRAAKALAAAVSLDIFTILGTQPLTCEALSTRSGLAPRGARDFFDCLVALRLLERDPGGRYSNAPEADLYLDRTKAGYIGGFVDHLVNREYDVWRTLPTALRTGVAQSDIGMAVDFSAQYANPERRESFLKRMTAGALLVAQEIAQRFPWSSYGTFVDIGTAEGCVPVEVAKVHPHIAGIGLDLPALQPAFESYVSRHALTDRIIFHPADFFADAFPEAEVLVMGRVLHNWDLPTKQALLQKAFAALPRGGALIVYERLIDDERRSNAAALLGSLQMLMMSAGGYDFCALDCVGWMREAGFRDMQVETLVLQHSMVIGRK
jgi:hypothetical protein